MIKLKKEVGDYYAINAKLNNEVNVFAIVNFQKKTEIIFKQENENNFLIEKIKSLEIMANNMMIEKKSPDRNTKKTIKNFF